MGESVGGDKSSPILLSPLPETGIEGLTEAELCFHDDSSSDCSLCITSLPSVITAKILSYLPWKDKLSAVAAVPLWVEHLRTSDAWHWFCSNYDVAATRQMLRQHHQMSCWCIRHYGRYFRNCRLVLHYLDLSDMGLELVEHLAHHCANMRSFRLYHPSCFTFTEQEVFEKYVMLLKLTVDNCRSLKHIALCNVDYLAMNKRSGIQELFECFVEEDISSHIHELEFSHAYDYSSPVSCLVHFDNLVSLKCPIQVLNTGIVLQLTGKKLRALHVVNDGATLNENYSELVEMQWADIHRQAAHLQVHYIVQGRTWRVDDLVPNPLIRTVVLDSLCNSINGDLVDSIGRMYGQTLQCYAHLATEWNYLPYEDLGDVPTMYAHLVRNCRCLDTFASAVEVPGTALLLMAANGKLSQVWVEWDKIILPGTDLDRALNSTWMWSMLIGGRPSREMLTRCDKS